MSLYSTGCRLRQLLAYFGGLRTQPGVKTLVPPTEEKLQDLLRNLGMQGSTLPPMPPLGPSPGISPDEVAWAVGQPLPDLPSADQDLAVGASSPALYLAESEAVPDPAAQGTHATRRKEERLVLSPKLAHFAFSCSSAECVQS